MSLDSKNGRFKAVIFDFDYTLADSSLAVVECINYALTGLNLPAADPEAIKRTIGLPLPIMLSTLAGPGHEHKADQFKDFFMGKADSVMVKKSFLFDHVKDTIETLKQAGLYLGIASTKHRFRIRQILDAHQMLAPFDIIIGGDDVLSKKPDPECLLMAIDHAGGSRETTLYVGDSLTDALTAQNARVAFVAVLSGVTRPDEFQRYPHMDIIEDLSQLTKAMENIE